MVLFIAAQVHQSPHLPHNEDTHICLRGCLDIFLPWDQLVVGLQIATLSSFREDVMFRKMQGPPNSFGRMAGTQNTHPLITDAASLPCPPFPLKGLNVP